MTTRAAGILFFAIVMMWFYSMAHAHDVYTNWVNKNNKGCCNNHDCAPLEEADESSQGGKLMVRVEGTWCPILPHHYLSKGNVPNASMSHVCVQKSYDNGPLRVPVCQRVLCYQPRPLI